MGRKSKYSAEFRAEAIRLSREPGHSSETVAADLGLTGITIRRWRHEFEAAADPELRRARAEHVELVALRRRIRVLEEEREILAKAAAFLGQESDRDARCVPLRRAREGPPPRRHDLPGPRHRPQRLPRLAGAGGPLAGPADGRCPAARRDQRDVRHEPPDVRRATDPRCAPGRRLADRPQAGRPAHARRRARRRPPAAASRAGNAARAAGRAGRA